MEIENNFIKSDVCKSHTHTKCLNGKWKFYGNIFIYQVDSKIGQFQLVFTDKIGQRNTIISVVCAGIDSATNKWLCTRQRETLNVSSWVDPFLLALGHPTMPPKRFDALTDFDVIQLWTVYQGGKHTILFRRPKISSTWSKEFFTSQNQS